MCVSDMSLWTHRRDSNTILHSILSCSYSFLPSSENFLLEYFFNLATKNPSILWVCEKNLLVSFKEGWKCFPLNLQKKNRKINDTTYNKMTKPLSQRITANVNAINQQCKCHSAFSEPKGYLSTQNVKSSWTFNLVIKLVFVIWSW